MEVSEISQADRPRAQPRQEEKKKYRFLNLMAASFHAVEPQPYFPKRESEKF